MSHRTLRVPSRVAEPGPGFWGLKVLTTGIGETLSDFLVKTFAPEAVVPLALLVLVAALVVQLRSGRYRPARYWVTALAVGVFGTMAADVLHVGLGVPYAVSSTAFALALAAVFITWWVVERDLSVHDVTTLRRECFYWAAVLATFALGTAVGDFSAVVLGLGYLPSGLLFVALIAVPAAVFAATRRAAVPLFWTAYVLTRPLGASFADWAAVSRDRGGLDLGTGAVSAAGLVVFAVAVGAAERRSAVSGRRAARAA